MSQCPVAHPQSARQIPSLKPITNLTNLYTNLYTKLFKAIKVCEQIRSNFNTREFNSRELV